MENDKSMFNLKTEKGYIAAVAIRSEERGMFVCHLAVACPFAPAGLGTVEEAGSRARVAKSDGGFVLISFHTPPVALPAAAITSFADPGIREQPHHFLAAVVGELCGPATDG
jgi:hypothetical protein